MTAEGILSRRLRPLGSRAGGVAGASSTSASLLSAFSPFLGALAFLGAAALPVLAFLVLARLPMWKRPLMRIKAFCNIACAHHRGQPINGTIRADGRVRLMLCCCAAGHQYKAECVLQYQQCPCAMQQMKKVSPAGADSAASKGPSLPSAASSASAASSSGAAASSLSSSSRRPCSPCRSCFSMRIFTSLQHQHSLNWFAVYPAGVVLQLFHTICQHPQVRCIPPAEGPPLLSISALLIRGCSSLSQSPCAVGHMESHCQCLMCQHQPHVCKKAQASRPAGSSHHVCAMRLS